MEFQHDGLSKHRNAGRECLRKPCSRQPSCASTSPKMAARFCCPVLAGPVGHVWYQFLDKFTRSRLRVGSPAFIATKVVLDEGVFGPIHVLGFFAYMTLAEGGSWQVRICFWLPPNIQCPGAPTIVGRTGGKISEVARGACILSA